MELLEKTLKENEAKRRIWAVLLVQTEKDTSHVALLEDAIPQFIHTRQREYKKACQEYQRAQREKRDPEAKKPKLSVGIVQSDLTEDLARKMAQQLNASAGKGEGKAEGGGLEIAGATEKLDLERWR